MNYPLPYRDEETLRDLYWNKGLGTDEVGDRLGCTGSTIHEWMVRYEIPRRPGGVGADDYDGTVEIDDDAEVLAITGDGQAPIHLPDPDAPDTSMCGLVNPDRENGVQKPRHVLGERDVCQRCEAIALKGGETA